jgi:hypothetical protein
VEGEKRLRASGYGRLRDFDGSDHGDMRSNMGCIDDLQNGNCEASGHGNVVSGMKDWRMEMWTAQCMRIWDAHLMAKGSRPDRPNGSI